MKPQNTNLILPTDITKFLKEQPFPNEKHPFSTVYQTYQRWAAAQSLPPVRQPMLATALRGAGYTVDTGADGYFWVTF